MSSEEVGASQVDAWLEPLPDEAAPCGPDLEYDNAFLELTKAAEGKPETQFEAGRPPDWRDVRERCVELFERTRDLRVAVLWLRAQVSLEGFGALSQGLRLVHGLMEAHWEHLHPVPDPDDQDPYARMNAIAVLREQENGLLGDLRQAVLFKARGAGETRIRAVEIALQLLSPRDGETALSKDQLQQMLAAAIAEKPELREQPAIALDRVKALAALIDERAGSFDTPDLKPLQSLLFAIKGVMPEAAAADEAGDEAAAGGEDGDEAGGGGGGGGGGSRKGLSGSVNSREEAIRAIDMICQYLEKAEPTNPAQLLLRRARRMISRNFLQLMKELAPDALSEVARVMGVDPDTVQIDEESA